MGRMGVMGLMGFMGKMGFTEHDKGRYRNPPFHREMRDL
jgi:hypothetical protein